MQCLGVSQTGKKQVISILLFTASPKTTKQRGNGFTCVRDQTILMMLLQVKQRTRIHLLGKNSALVGEKYNCEKQSHDASITEGYFPTGTEGQSVGNDKDDNALQRELSLSAMLFSTLGDNDFEPVCNDNNRWDTEDVEDDLNLEKVTETEGLRYFGGFIAHKFPKYQFLGEKVGEKDNTWIGAVDRGFGLMKPSDDFFQHLQMMETLFGCHHGEKTLKPGKGAIKQLTSDITKFVSLPTDVIAYYVRCRIFFRMRELNRTIKSARKQSRKMLKVVK